MGSKSLSSDRIIFLDNIRSLMIVFVLIFHSGAAYSSAVDFWPYQERATSGLIDFYMLLCDLFMMSTLFFISGYFAMPSYKKKGPKLFLKSKFRALGLPWLIITVCVLPVLDYINYVYQFDNNIGFFEYWFKSMKKILEFNFGFLDMSKFTPMIDQFYQRYVWFLSLLLVYFVAFTVFMVLKERFVKEVHTHKNIVENKAKSFVFIVVTLLTILFFGFAKLFFYDEILGSGWYSFGGLIEFQLGKFFIYSIYFIFGVYSYNRKWFTAQSGVGKVWLWALGNFAAFGMNMLVFKILDEVTTPDLKYKLMHVVLYPIWTLTFLGLFLSIGYKYWNKKSWFNGDLSKNSYKMYLVHYIFPMTIPLVISGLEIAILLKFFIVSVVTILCSYLFSKYILKVKV